jgi:uncharacterized membrane protein YdbT with pleckstrin-like domain
VSIADNLIANETIDVRSSKAWIAPIRDSWVPALLILAAFLVNWITPGADTGIAGTVANLLDLVRLGLVVVGVGWIVYNIVAWRTAEFVVTNLRVLREEGLVSHRSSATLLTSVSDVKSRVGLLGRALHYGDLEISTQAGPNGLDRFTSITEPEAFRNAIMTRKMADRPGAVAAASAAPDMAPAAAIAPVAGVAPTAAASPVSGPAPAAAPAPSSADLAALLASLADLRDKGAITPEEYEAKKADILSRM